MKPKLAKETISAIQRIVTGNPAEEGASLSPYRSGPALVSFFNEMGFEDSYSMGGGFPSRWAFAEEHLTSVNGTERIVVALEAAVAPAAFLGTPYAVDQAVAYLNKFLDFDGLHLVAAGKAFKLRLTGEPMVAVETALQPGTHVSHEFIREQIDKCEKKLSDGDYDGAITNARSVVEAVLSDIERRLCALPTPYDGDLPKLFKRVQKLLNLDPERPDISESLRQLLRGLVSVIAGLAPLRNKLSDAHVRSYKPARHHAKLAVNSAMTLLDFIYDTFEYQKA